MARRLIARTSCAGILRRWLRRLAPFTAACLCAGAGAGIAQPPAPLQLRPEADAHAHVLSPAAAAWLERTGSLEGNLEAGPLGARQLVAMLDSAGIRAGVLVSGAYLLSPGPAAADADEEERVRAENDWALAQAALHRDRLVAFCSVNPLRGYAGREAARCARADPTAGLKLHLPASGVELRRPEHRAALRRLFRTAARRRLPVLLHLRSAEDFGPADAALLVREVLSAAPELDVQVAHLGGWCGYDDATDEVLGAFVRLVAAREPGTARLTFDIAAVFLGGAGEGADAEEARLRGRLVERLRALGPGRVVFGSDWPFYPAGAYLEQVARELGDHPDLLAQLLSARPRYLPERPRARGAP